MKTLLLIKKITFISAIILTVPSLFLLVRTQLFINRAMPLSGVISEVSSSTGENGTTYLPTVRFELDEKEHEFKSNAGTGNPERYLQGAEIDILVDPSNPERAEINARWELWASSIVVGGFTALVWLTYLVVMHDLWRKKKYKQYMIKNGVPIESVISEVKTEVIKATNSGVTMRKTVWRVYAKGLYAGKERIFKSDRIAKDPSIFGIERGAKIVVYVHPKKPKKIFMDFSSFPGSESIM